MDSHVCVYVQYMRTNTCVPAILFKRKEKRKYRLLESGDYYCYSALVL